MEDERRNRWLYGKSVCSKLLHGDASENFVMISNSSIAQSICLKTAKLTQELDLDNPMLIKVINKSYKQVSDILI